MSRIVKNTALAIILAALVWAGLPAAKPAAALASDGPWLVYSVMAPDDVKNNRASQLWIANADGSGKKQVVKNKQIINFVADPQGKYVAYISATYPQPDYTFQPVALTLNLLTLPAGTSKAITTLTNKQTEPTTNDRDEPLEAVTINGRDHWSMQWSPDGQTLAFIGAQGGPSADVFIYSLATKKVTQLSSGASQALSPSWSPDGKYVVQVGVDGFGTGAGWSMAGVWASKADNSGTLTLYKPAGGGEGLLGWLNPTTFMAWSWKIDCGPSSIRAYNFSNKKEDMWFKGYFDAAAFAPDSQVLLYSAEKNMCQEDMKDGVYLVSAKQRKPKLILEGKSPDIRWSPEMDAFLVKQDSGILAVAIGGSTAPLDIEGLTVIPEVSPDANTLAWTANNTLNIAPAGGGDVTQVADNVLQVRWAH